MQALSKKATDGTLTPEERTEAADYERVGTLLAILQSRARSRHR